MSDVHWHWQNLRESKHDGWLHGRCWWHFGDRPTIQLEWCIGQLTCHVGLSTGDRLTLFCAVPPIGLYLVFEHFTWIDWLMPKQTRDSVVYPGKAVVIPDQRTCEITISDWTIRISPWSKTDECHSKDPWWVRGLSLDLKDLILGRIRFESVVEREFDITIPMVEGPYKAHVKIERSTWKRPRSPFTRRRTAASVDIDGGIPFPGKGENSWDYGMDGLFGYGCSSTLPEAIIAKGVQNVLGSRRRYAGSVDWVPPEGWQERERERAYYAQDRQALKYPDHLGQAMTGETPAGR